MVDVFWNLFVVYKIHKPVNGKVESLSIEINHGLDVTLTVQTTDRLVGLN